jgi:hypothetical protein
MTEKDMKLVFNLTRFEMQYPRFAESIGIKIANEEILKPIHSRMKDFRYSEKIINSTRIEDVEITSSGQLVFDVVSDYTSKKGFDVSEAREKGTIRHFIKPLSKGGTLRFLLGGFIVGFSKGHWVKGITKSNVIEKTINQMTPIAQTRLNKETDEFLQRSLAE